MFLQVETSSASSIPPMSALAAVSNASAFDYNDEGCEDALPYLEVFMPGTSHHFKHDFTPMDMPTTVASAEAAPKAVIGRDKKTAVDMAHHMEPEQASPAESQVGYNLFSLASLSGFC